VNKRLLVMLLAVAMVAGAPALARATPIFFDDFSGDAHGVGLTETTHWNVLAGTVNIVQCGRIGTNCLELVGGIEGVHIETKSPLPVQFGATYQLLFTIPGGIAEAITVTVAPFFSRVISDFTIPLTFSDRMLISIPFGAVNALPIVITQTFIAFQMFAQGPGPFLGSVSLSRVPEPATVALLAIALACLVVVRLARERKAGG
jgi:hypothetical protein